MMKNIEELKNIIEKNYGFKKELIHDVDPLYICNCVYFKVNNINYRGLIESPKNRNFDGLLPDYCILGYQDLSKDILEA